MAEILLLRHGQASFGAADYDQLSEQGHLQARYLGDHLKALGRKVDRVVAGTMVRHRQTARGVCDGLDTEIPVETHPGLNEYDFQGLLDPLKSRFPELWVETGHARRDYYHNMKQALGLWVEGAIDSDGHDSWGSFSMRVQAALDAVCNSSAKRTLVVSSGGPIAAVVARLLGLSADKFCNLTLQVKNSSLTTLLYNRVELTLDGFNDISHLLTPDKQQHITFS